ncbi:MAG: hypothetical protein ACFFCS_11290 [Candidatus Hodarchaeota archaeon]
MNEVKTGITVPEWSDLKNFTDDLRDVMEMITEDDIEKLGFRPNFAMAIATMRADRAFAERVKQFYNSPASDRKERLRDLVVYLKPPVGDVK